MYVCVCNAITDRQVRAAIGAGVRDAERVHPHFGCETQCGRCLDMIADMVAAERQQASDMPARVAA